MSKLTPPPTPTLPRPPDEQEISIQQFMEPLPISREDILAGLRSLRLSMAFFLSPYSDMLQKEYRESGRASFITPGDIQWVNEAISQMESDRDQLEGVSAALRSLRGI